MSIERVAQTLVDELKEKLGDSLLATDVWIKGERTSLAGHNPQPAATRLFDEFHDYLESNLRQSQFPRLNRYFLLELEDENTVVVVNYGKVLQGMLVNLRSKNMGAVVSIAIPHLFRTWKSASAQYL